MRYSRAFTLIELLISIMLSLVIIGALFYFTIGSAKLMNRTSENSSSSQAVRFVADRIWSDFVQSSGVSSTSTSSKLVIGNITYQFMENKVRREENGSANYLTIENEVNGLSFTYPSAKMVRIEITPKIGEVYYLNAYARN